jgi:hypothetical protein
MRVKCIANSVSTLDSPALRDRLNRSIHLDGPLSDLDLGKIYNVIALQESDGGVWLMLHTVEESDHPYPYPVEMFEVLDPALPADWCVNFAWHENGLFVKRISFPEWANDAQFYERLLNGDGPTISIYQKLRLRAGA